MNASHEFATDIITWEWVIPDFGGHMYQRPVYREEYEARRASKSIRKSADTPVDNDK